MKFTKLIKVGNKTTKINLVLGKLDMRYTHWKVFYE